jgi:hypothetical protein
MKKSNKKKMIRFQGCTTEHPRESVSLMFRRVSIVEERYCLNEGASDAHAAEAFL